MRPLPLLLLLLATPALALKQISARANIPLRHAEARTLRMIRIYRDGAGAVKRDAGMATFG